LPKRRQQKRVRFRLLVCGREVLFPPSAYGAGAGEVAAAADHTAHDGRELGQVHNAFGAGLDNQTEVDLVVDLDKNAAGDLPNCGL
jgi:hypothetical protein